MKHIKVFENWQEDTIKYDKIDREKVASIKNKLNSFEFRVTDDSRTLDYMMKVDEKIESDIIELNKTEIFEVIIGLNENGMQNFLSKYYPIWKRVHKDVSIWDIRNLDLSIKIRKESF